MPEPIVPSQNASTSSSLTPAEPSASFVESTSSSSTPLSQCSPKGVQPMPTIATRSRIPCEAMRSTAFLLRAFGATYRSCFPEVIVHAVGGEQAPERHLDAIANLD